MLSARSSLFLAVFVPSMTSTRFASERQSHASFVPDPRLQKTVSVRNKIEVLLSRVDTVEKLLDSSAGDRGEEKRRGNFLRFGRHLPTRATS